MSESRDDIAGMIRGILSAHGVPVKLHAPVIDALIGLMENSNLQELLDDFRIGRLVEPEALRKMEPHVRYAQRLMLVMEELEPTFAEVGTPEEDELRMALDFERALGFVEARHRHFLNTSQRTINKAWKLGAQDWELLKQVAAPNSGQTLARHSAKTKPAGEDESPTG